MTADGLRLHLEFFLLELLMTMMTKIVKMMMTTIIRKAAVRHFAHCLIWRGVFV